MKDEFSDLTLWAYLDDLSIIGPAERVAQAFGALCDHASGIGLEVHPAKCKLSTHFNDQYAPFRGMNIVHAEQGQKLLGAFVSKEGADETRWVVNQMPKLQTFLDRLQHLSLQSAYILLKRCGVPRWDYLMRCHEPEVTAKANVLADKAIQECASELLGGFEDLEKNPFHSTLMTGDLLGTKPFAQQAATLYSRTKAEVLGCMERRRSALTRYEESKSAVRKETSELHNVHSLQLMDKRTRNWTEARRNRGEYFMRDAEWQTAMRMRYLIAPTSDPFAQCECGDILSNKDFVVHALDCNKVKGDTAATRHKLVKNAFVHLLRQYGFTPDNHEPRFSAGQGPDVCFMLGGKICLVDVTVVNPLAPSYVKAEWVAPGNTLERVESLKVKAHSDMATKRGMHFYPLAFTAFGVAGKRTVLLLKEIARYTYDRKGFLRHALQAINVAVQKGNAAILSSAIKEWRKAGVR